MARNRETGARASRFGHSNATVIIKKLRGTDRKAGSNEFTPTDERVSLHSSHYRKGKPQSVGVTLNCLKHVKSVLGAFQEDNGSYLILKLTAKEFKAASRPTASLGASSGRVVVAKRSAFQHKSRRVAVLNTEQ